MKCTRLRIFGKYSKYNFMLYHKSVLNAAWSFRLHLHTEYRMLFIELLDDIINVQINIIKMSSKISGFPNWKLRNILTCFNIKNSNKYHVKCILPVSLLVVSKRWIPHTSINTWKLPESHLNTDQVYCIRSYLLSHVNTSTGLRVKSMKPCTRYDVFRDGQ
jgi:hypothetical protein